MPVEMIVKQNFDAMDKAIKNFWTNLVQSANAKSLVLSSVDIVPAGDGVVEIGRELLRWNRRAKPPRKWR
jgi:hypothetical protein